MIKNLFILSRPRFWLYTLGPYILGISTVSNIQKLLTFEILYGIVYFLFFANVFIYGINDYFDRNLDRKNPKKHRQERYMRMNETNLYLTACVISGALAIPFLFMNLISATAILLYIFFGFFYSSPPLRFKIRPILDSASNFFYILPGVIGYALVRDTLPTLNVLIAAALWSISMHLFSAIVDMGTDKKAGIKTTATLLGRNWSLFLTSMLWFVSLVFVLPYSPLLLLGLMYPIMPLYVLITRSDITKAYWLFPWINAAMGFILFCVVMYGT